LIGVGVGSVIVALALQIDPERYFLNQRASELRKPPPPAFAAGSIGGVVVRVGFLDTGSER
jgi:hypothetical protein